MTAVVVTDGRPRSPPGNGESVNRKPQPPEETGQKIP